MRRLSIVLAVALLVACASSERPEGIVERWIVSMNQGIAGEPWRWAFDGATVATSPTWDTDEPGSIDSFSLGSARAEGDRFVVPFSIERLDGTVISGDAIMGNRSLADGTSRLGVIEVHLGAPEGETGRWQEGAPGSAWPIAAGLGILVAVLSAAGVRLVRDRSR
jgi:hypothetical protein